MSYLLEEELASQGISTKTTLRIKLDNRIYVRVKTLPMKFYEQAKTIKEEYTARNINSLLIQHKSWIAIWTEEQNQAKKLDKTESKYLYKLQNKYSSFEHVDFPLTSKQKKYRLDSENFLTFQEFASKSSGKKDRGVSYEDNFLEQAHLTSVVQDPYKKYRGVTYGEFHSHKGPKKPNKCAQFARKYRGYAY